MITYHLFTDVGGRSKNEDYMGMAEKDGRFFFVVCDGLGGHDKGEVASHLVVEEVMRFFYEYSEEDKWLENAIMHSQDALMDKQNKERAFGKMKTTFVGMTLKDNRIQWAHVGDSRLYHFAGNHLHSRTLDHSVPQSLANAHQIKEKEIRNHPDRNRLLRVMGSEWEMPRYEICKEKTLDRFHKRHAFLLCTDGFWELIEEKEMITCLKNSSSAKEWIEAMANIVRHKGQGTHMDNYTAIGIIFEN